MHKIMTVVGWTTTVLVLYAGAYVGGRLADDRPVEYADPVEHFKYGSTGGERGYQHQFGFGVPYWIWVALPRMFANHMPDGRGNEGYAPFGMIYEDDRDPRYDLPIGMSMRSVQNVDRVYFNCALCHTGSIRERRDGERQIVLGMPANTFDLGALVLFLNDASSDWRFRASRMMPLIGQIAEERGETPAAESVYRPADLGLIDRALFKLVVVSQMREELSNTLGRLSFINFSSWGPGRVDTINAPKALLGFRMDNASPRELFGVADFPSVWNQAARKGMWLHWDGNNCSVDERNLSAGFGTGATPATIDVEKMLRVADWLWDQAMPPAFPAARIDSALLPQGETVYAAYCLDCHGAKSPPYRNAESGGRVGEVTPIDEIRTDRGRLDSYTAKLAVAQNSIYAGYPPGDPEVCREYAAQVCNADQSVEEYRALRQQCFPARFSHFRKTNGYANMPLDGIWTRAPYLHNGSVPTLFDLLNPARMRPAELYIGYDVYDYDRVGFDTQSADARATGWRVLTTERGNGNRGHEGHAYGTELDPGAKAALIEYLKTF